ncbi:hypothetical protein V6N13_077459 [Hibiscus sabdariffa]|uniref:Uncharacterized protein n=1 Tax=Hibiscus sabdariffa TaxID=183260 RepID=A0ABR2CNX6_9ROSI
MAQSLQAVVTQLFWPLAVGSREMSLKPCLRSECERVLLPEFPFEVSYGFIINSGTAAAMVSHKVLLGIVD